MMEYSILLLVIICEATAQSMYIYVCRCTETCMHVPSCAKQVGMLLHVYSCSVNL